MLKVDCTELTTDEMLALASSINEGMHGKAIALVNNGSVVIDQVDKDGVSVGDISSLVREFISRRKDSEHYSMNLEGDTIIINSADPVAAKASKRPAGLPQNILACPFCPFVTPYQELYNTHVATHLW